MITRSNHNEKVKDIDFSKLSSGLQDGKRDFNAMNEFYNDDKEIANVIDAYLAELNSAVGSGKKKPKVANLNNALPWEKWKKETEKLLDDRFGLDIDEVSDSQLLGSYDGGDTPAEFTDWYKSKYDLDDDVEYKPSASFKKGDVVKITDGNPVEVGNFAVVKEYYPKSGKDGEAVLVYIPGVLEPVLYDISSVLQANKPAIELLKKGAERIAVDINNYSSGLSGEDDTIFGTAENEIDDAIDPSNDAEEVYDELTRISDNWDDWQSDVSSKHKEKYKEFGKRLSNALKQYNSASTKKPEPKEKYGVVEFFNDYDTSRIKDPFDKGIKADVVVYDDKDGSKTKRNIWIESEKAVRKDLNALMSDSQAIDSVKVEKAPAESKSKPKNPAPKKKSSPKSNADAKEAMIKSTANAKGFKDWSVDKVIEQARKFQSLRNRGGDRDEKSDSKKRLSPTPENLLRWMNNPGSFDLIGIDTYKANDPTSNLKLKKEVWWNKIGLKFKG